MHIHRMAALALAAAMLGGAAQSAVITRTFDFRMSDFGGDAGKPFDPYEGRFTITWDNAQDYTNETSGIVLRSLTSPIGSALAFDYDHSLDLLTIGGAASGAPELASDSHDFFAEIYMASSDTPGADPLARGRYSWQGLWYFARYVTASQVAAVPEPGAWAMMILGFCGVGAALRRRPAVA